MKMGFLTVECLRSNVQFGHGGSRRACEEVGRRILCHLRVGHPRVGHPWVGRQGQAAYCRARSHHFIVVVTRSAAS